MQISSKRSTNDKISAHLKVTVSFNDKGKRNLLQQFSAPYGYARCLSLRNSVMRPG